MQSNWHSTSPFINELIEDMSVLYEICFGLAFNLTEKQRIVNWYLDSVMASKHLMKKLINIKQNHTYLGKKKKAYGTVILTFSITNTSIFTVQFYKTAQAK